MWYCHCIGCTVLCLFTQNLDVNQALNNLLSREDDDDDMHEEGGAMIGLNLPSGGVVLLVSGVVW